MRYFLILLLVILFGGVFIWFGIYAPKDSNSVETTAFLVKKGEGAKEISAHLKEQDLIRHSLLFRFYVLAKGVSGNLKAGEYSLSKAMNVSEVVNKFVSGDVVKKKITIIEGWNLRDIGWDLENKGIAQAQELFELVGFPATDYSVVADLPKPKDFSKEFNFLKDKPKNLGLEGYLFPDTYYIIEQRTENNEQELEDIVCKMLTNFGEKLTPDLRQEIANQDKTIFETATMASMIEKEVRTFEDKKIVSGILWKRLENGIPLQVDATINYIIGKKTTKISKADLRIDSLFNTYKHRGLPLGPISNPGIESILASLYPENSGYWYYLSTPEGETIFSKTLEQHNIAKAKYLK